MRAFALAAVVGVAWCVSAAAAGSPVFWPTNYAASQVYKTYEAQGAEDVSCAPVGPYTRQHGSEFFGEFACDVFMADSEYVLALIPTGSTTWRALKPGQASPVAVRLAGVAAAGSPRRVALFNIPNKHDVGLDDASTWKLDDPTNRLARWKPGDTVTVQPGDSAKHFYRVVNRVRGDNLEADFVGFG